MTSRLIRIANRLGELEAGRVEADNAIHVALGRTGTALGYTSDEAAARSLLPPGIEWIAPVHSAGVVYAACRRSGMCDGYPYAQNGQWGRTVPLAMCGAVLRAYAMLNR